MIIRAFLTSEAGNKKAVAIGLSLSLISLELAVLIAYVKHFLHG